MIRMITKTAPSTPSASMTRLSGTLGGSSNPDSCSATSARISRPTKKTSFPRMPLFQPVTASFTPVPEPAYQPMKDESMSTRPATQVMRKPAAHRPPDTGRE